MKNLKIKVWFLILGFIILFSCSKEDESREPKNSYQENFINLSLVKEIATDMKFNGNTNSQTGKSSVPIITKKNIDTIEEIKNDEGMVVFYAVNYIEGGYILLAADNRAIPIIGFSENDKFIVDKGQETYPLGLASWVKNAKKKITDIQKSKLKQTEKEKSTWIQVENILINQSLTGKVPSDKCYDRVTTETKEPLLRTFWKQKDGYNARMPRITCNGIVEPALAGCVPIAMAQVMKFHEYPKDYDWSYFPLNSPTVATADFILDIHNAIRNVYPAEPSYGCGGTGVNKNCDMGKVLKTQFKYTSADYSNYDYKVVKENILLGEPVLLQGFGDRGGHMWVCDGYKAIKYEFSNCTGYSTLYLHMNWGWEAETNGYYAYNEFTLQDTGNVANTSFNKEVKMIYNIKP